MASTWYRLARRVRRLIGIDRERRWNKQYARGGWEWLRRIDELAHYSVLAGYLLRLKPQARVLELGCGEGLLLDHLHPASYSTYQGVDFAEPVAQAQRRTRDTIRFTVGDMVDFGTEERFDAIVFNESLYYLPDVVTGLARYETMLATDGVFLVSMCDNAGNEARWREVDAAYLILDEVGIRNRHGTAWTVKALAPRSAGT